MPKMTLTTTKGQTIYVKYCHQSLKACGYIAVLYVNADHAIGSWIGKSFYTAKVLVSGGWWNMLENRDSPPYDSQYPTSNTQSDTTITLSLASAYMNKVNNYNANNKEWQANLNEGQSEIEMNHTFISSLWGTIQCMNAPLSIKSFINRNCEMCPFFHFNVIFYIMRLAIS